MKVTPPNGYMYYQSYKLDFYRINASNLNLQVKIAVFCLILVVKILSVIKNINFVLNYFTAFLFESQWWKKIRFWFMNFKSKRSFICVPEFLFLVRHRLCSCTIKFMSKNNTSSLWYTFKRHTLKTNKKNFVIF